MSNETASQESSLSIYLEVGVSEKSPKIELEFKNISGAEKLRYSQVFL